MRSKTLQNLTVEDDTVVSNLRGQSPAQPGIDEVLQVVADEIKGQDRMPLYVGEQPRQCLAAVYRHAPHVRHPSVIDANVVSIVELFEQPHQ